MPDTNREGYVKLGYEIDQGSINAVNQATTAVESRLAALQKTTAGIRDAAAKTGTSLKDAFSRSEAAIKADQKAVDDLRKSLSEAKDEADQLGKAGTGGGKFNVEGLRRAGGALSALGLGDIGGGVSRIGDIAEVGKELKNLGDAAKGLPGVLGEVATAGAAVGGSFGAVALVAAPVALAVADVAIGMKLLQDSAERAAKVEADEHQERLRQIEELNRVRKKARTTTPEQSALETGDLVADRAEQQKELDRLKARKAEIDAAYEALGSSFNPKARGDLKAAGDANKKAIDEQLAAMDQANKQYIENTQVLDPLIQKHEAERKAVQDLLDVANAKSGADRLQAQVLDRLQAATEGRVAISQKEYQAIEANIKASGKLVDDRIAQNQRDIAANNDLIASLEKLGPDNEAAVNQIVALKAANAKLAAETDQLVKVTAPLVKQRQDEADAAAKAKKFFYDLSKGIEDNAKKAEDAAKKAKAELDKQVQEVVDRDKRLADVQQKFNDASVKIDENDKAARLASFQKYEDTVAGIEQKSLEARADLQTKYADQLVDIARKAADDAAKALTDLEQKQADLRTSLGRDEAKAGRDAADRVLDIQIKAQREEKVALEEHLQRLKDIRRGDYVADQKDLLDRNFQSIYLRRLGQTQQMEQENTKFAQDRGKRDQTIRDEQQDAQRQAQIARRERLIAFEQANADAKLAYQRERAAQEVARQQSLREAQIAHTRELEQQRIAKERELRAANQAYQRELTDLAAKLAREKATLNSAYDAELRLASTYGKARVEAERKTQQALLDQANARLRATAGGSSGGSVRPAGHGVMERAGGGWLDAGQMSMVNEPGSSGRESFNGVPLPGAGLFIPAKAGYVNPNGGGGGTSITIPMTIVGATDPAATARAVDERLVVRLNQIFGSH